MNSCGLFVGLVTLDLIYLTAKFPNKNQKIVAKNQTIATGGPATNAAVAFSYLGSKATVLGVIGNHPISNIIRRDLETYSVEIVDLESSRNESPPVSSIITTESTGERAVISINATKFQGSGARVPENILEGINIVLIDGHQMVVSEAIAREAKAKGIPVVMDGGSWKPGLERVLPLVDYGICSADFYPPDCKNHQDVFTYLQKIGIPYLAITDGEKPIQYLERSKISYLEIPETQVIDTLGAGDILHGAFCHYILQEKFINALAAAAKIASHSCQFFGTRQFYSSTKI